MAALASPGPSCTVTPGPFLQTGPREVGLHCPWGPHPCCEPRSLRRRPEPPQQLRVPWATHPSHTPNDGGSLAYTQR